MLFGFAKDFSQHNYWNSCIVDKNRHYLLFVGLITPILLLIGGLAMLPILICIRLCLTGKLRKLQHEQQRIVVVMSYY
jgi:hypothetical protein